MDWRHIVPTMAKEDGFKIVASIGTQLTTQDYTAPIAQALAAKPDGMAILQIGTSNPTAMTQLRQAGYTGSVLGSSGSGFGILKPAGAAAAGMVWSVDYSPLNKTAASESSSSSTRPRIRAGFRQTTLRRDTTRCGCWRAP